MHIFKESLILRKGVNKIKIFFADMPANGGVVNPLSATRGEKESECSQIYCYSCRKKNIKKKQCALFLLLVISETCGFRPR